MFSVRQGNAIGFAACAAMMAYALYAEYVLALEPCPLCIFQRIATIVLGVVFLGAALAGPGRLKQRINALLILMTSAAGAGIAGRHVWLQNLPPDEVPACGPGLDFILDAFPLSQALQMVFTGSGECATVSWSFLGLSMPTWTLICFVALAGFGLWVNLRPADPVDPG